ncbi:hypothetical protein [Candidatus Similichlamydia laticola]|uniref:Uncharacterized protein n=1 Tax=Candidatus Similichlamydia laticola TaxID=2170265 RepID=A0A369KEX8_9BACT|nr:hypothetical protein [Candidatus Similichlamydia laticola]RDB31447.1 hypothetical protein HAT2_00448 [Candidatus Similichlamydia laticola]
MKQRGHKETEKAWIESLYLWKKRNLLVISSPKGSKEKGLALDLQKFLQKRLRQHLEGPDKSPFNMPQDTMIRLATQEDLLPQEDFLELYRITFGLQEARENEEWAKEDVTTLHIIKKQRRFAEKTKEIHQRKNWAPV